MHLMSDQEKVFLRLIEEAGGHQAALWVRRLHEHYSKLHDELQDRERSDLPLRQLEQLRREHHRTRMVVAKIRKLVDRKSVPVGEIRRLAEEELTSPPEAPGEVLPFPAGSPR